MADIYAFMAPGFEEVECLSVVDLLIRAGLEVNLVSVGNTLDVAGAHQITVKADCMLADVDWDGGKAFFLPGGMPGAANLEASGELKAHITEEFEKGKRIAAICAAPSVLGAWGILEGRMATCYPGYEGKLTGATHTHTGVVTDGSVTTARGLGYALDLGLELIRLLKDGETAAKVKMAIQYD